MFESFDDSLSAVYSLKALPAGKVTAIAGL